MPHLPLEDIYREYGSSTLEQARTDVALSAAIDQMHASLVARGGIDADADERLLWTVYLYGYANSALQPVIDPVERWHCDAQGYHIAMIQAAAACRIALEKGIIPAPGDLTGE